MAIQVLPILKALAPVITTAGSMYAEWQRNRRPDQEGGMEPERRQALEERVRTLEAAAAENSHLIAQLAEQLRQTALQLEEAGRAAEVSQMRFRRLAAAGISIAVIALVLAIWQLVL